MTAFEVFNLVVVWSAFLISAWAIVTILVTDGYSKYKDYPRDECDF